MLVLSFSVVRLIAIRRPLQVGLVAYVISRDFDWHEVQLSQRDREALGVSSNSANSW